MVIRDELGNFFRGKNFCFQESVAVMEEEARGVQLAAEWIEEMELQNVDVECNSVLVVKAVKNANHYFLEIGHILDYCRLKFSS